MSEMPSIIKNHNILINDNICLLRFQLNIDDFLLRYIHLTMFLTELSKLILPVVLFLFPFKIAEVKNNCTLKSFKLTLKA